MHAPAAMNTIPLSVTPTTALRPALLGKTFPKTGFARSAVSARTLLKKHKQIPDGIPSGIFLCGSIFQIFFVKDSYSGLLFVIINLMAVRDG